MGVTIGYFVPAGAGLRWSTRLIEVIQRIDMDEIAVRYSARAAQQRRIAAAALPAFGLADASYQLIKHATTSTFQVVLRIGQPCVLRLQRLSRMSLGVVQSEVRWLTDLHQHTPLLAPAPIPASNGEQDDTPYKENCFLTIASAASAADTPAFFHRPPLATRH